MQDGTRNFISRRITEGRTGVGRRRRQQQHPVLSETYRCTSPKKLREFVSELLLLQERTYHKMRLTIDEGRVTVETWTPNQGVTELDEEYIQEATEIYEQVTRPTRLFL